MYLHSCLESLGITATSVLDFGCGTGGSTSLFFDLLGVNSVLGVDISEQSLQIARQRAPHRDTNFELTTSFTPASDKDLAFCNGVLHHIPLADRLESLDYMFRSLRSGGVIACWENNPYSPAARYVMSRIPFDRDAIMVWPSNLRSMLKQVGFQIVRTDYHFIFPRCLRLLRPLETPVAKMPFGAQYQVLAIRP
ncbi:class I SAM-dependent methyltransferase [Blastopirellula marina]|nr:class I SAM-dependent methyltransferase [Blastopirellula marina]